MPTTRYGKVRQSERPVQECRACICSVIGKASITAVAGGEKSVSHADTKQDTHELRYCRAPLKYRACVETIPNRNNRQFTNICRMIWLFFAKSAVASSTDACVESEN